MISQPQGDGAAHGHIGQRAWGLNTCLLQTILTGVIQNTGRLFKTRQVDAIRIKSVVIGFVNALAILIFMAQLPELINDLACMLWLLLGPAIIYLFL